MLMLVYSRFSVPELLVASVDVTHSNASDASIVLFIALLPFIHCLETLFVLETPFSKASAPLPAR